MKYAHHTFGDAAATARARRSRGQAYVRLRKVRRLIRDCTPSEPDCSSGCIDVVLVDTVLHAFGDLTDGQLVDLSHAPAGPWDVIKQRAKNERMVGLRISNELIAQRFGKHKLSTCTLTSSGDVYDGKDAPIAYHGFG